MKSKNSLVIGTIGILLILIGVSYAFFTYTREGAVKSELVAGNIYMHYSEKNEIMLSNSFPQTKEEGILNDYFEFTVSGLNESNQIAYYAINLIYGDEVSGRQRFDDEDIVFYLTEVIDGEEEVLVDSVQYKNISNAKIWVETFAANTTSEEKHTYRLRMWLSENVLISDTNAKADYTSSEFANSYASIKLNVVGNLQENDINMILNANDDNFVSGKRAIDVSSYGYAGDNLVLEITSDDENIKFMYEDERGNSSTVNNDSLTLNYSMTSDEIIVTRIILVPQNDANTNANIYFKLTRNGVVVEEQVKSVAVYGNNYCLNNGFNKLSDCLLVSEAMSNSVSDAKTVISNKETPDFSKTAPVMKYVQSITKGVTTAVATTGQQFYVSKEVSFDATTGKHTLKSPVSTVSLDETGTYQGYYTCGGTGYGYSGCTTVYKIDEVSISGTTTTLTKYDKYTYAVAEDFDASETGLYKTTDDDGDSYYYRGSVTNNNVRFAGENWKVVRINGDGSIRLISANNVTSSQYNSKYEDPTYVGYTYNETFSEDETVSSEIAYYNLNVGSTYYYGTSYTYDAETNRYTLKVTDEKPLKSGIAQAMVTTDNINNGYIYTCFSGSETGTCQVLKQITRAYTTNATYVYVKYISHSSTSYEGTIGNDNKSTIMKALNTWYENNLSNYTDYFQDTFFCNDRSIKDATYNSGYKITQNTYYASYTRNTTNKAPSLLCANKSDRYTVSAVDGNTWLDYPVGLISIDEVMMAGGVYNMYNEKYYLRNNAYFWTGSPSIFRADLAYARAWFVTPSGLTFPYNPVSTTYGVRPVINLKSSIQISQGDGTIDNPYVIL